MTANLTRKEATDDQRLEVVRFLAQAESALMSAAMVKCRPGQNVLIAAQQDLLILQARRLSVMRYAMERDIADKAKSEDLVDAAWNLGQSNARTISTPQASPAQIGD